MNCVVFSRDRAMQLDAFLESVDLYVPSLFETVSVLYKPTSEAFAKAYSSLAAQRSTVHWVRETSFRENLQALVGEADNTVFHTDDDVYFRTPDPFDLREDEVCFTLRLGLNTTYSYTLDVEERLIGADVIGNRVVWDWRSQGAGSYSYPLAVNGHVFRTEDVVDWLERARFSNPNELEAALQTFNSQLEPKMASFKHSVVVSIPANIVNETYVNRHGSLFTAEELNDRFIAGERIDLDSMDFSRIAACHQEIPFIFRQGPPRRQAPRETRVAHARKNSHAPARGTPRKRKS